MLELKYVPSLYQLNEQNNNRMRSIFVHKKSSIAYEDLLN